MVKTEKHILDITPDDLYANYRKKPCQVGCGVYCAVSTSLLVENPAKLVGREIVARAKRVPALMRSAFAPAAAESATDPSGAGHVNGSRENAPPAEADERLVGSAER